METKEERTNENGVALLWFIVAVVINTEAKVVDYMKAVIERSRDFMPYAPNTGRIMWAVHNKGYVYVEATAKHIVEALCFGVPGKQPNRLKGVKRVLGAVDEAGFNPVGYLAPRKSSDGLSVGMPVVINKGAFKGEYGVIERIVPATDTVQVGVLSISIHMTHTLSAKHVTPQ
mgnify:CR=1 FL=1